MLFDEVELGRRGILNVDPEIEEDEPGSHTHRYADALEVCEPYHILRVVDEMLTGTAAGGEVN